MAAATWASEIALAVAGLGLVVGVKIGRAAGRRGSPWRQRIPRTSRGPGSPSSPTRPGGQRATHSNGTISRRRTSLARPARRAAGQFDARQPARWLGTRSANRSSQNTVSAVSTSPLPGTGSSRTTSKAEMWSLATSSRWLSSTSYRSRTLPDPRGRNSLWGGQPPQRLQSLEHGPAGTNRARSRAASRSGRQPRPPPGATSSVAEAALALPGRHGRPLHLPGVLPGSAGVDQGEQGGRRPGQPAGRLEVGLHPLRGDARRPATSQWACSRA